MIFDLTLIYNNGKEVQIKREFKSNDIKHINGMKLPKEDNAGEYIYILHTTEQCILPTYYYKISDNVEVPCNTNISIENDVDEIDILEPPTTICNSDEKDMVELSDEVPIIKATEDIMIIPKDQYNRMISEGIKLEDQLEELEKRCKKLEAKYLQEFNKNINT